jgi:hypothetical protein
MLGKLSCQVFFERQQSLLKFDKLGKYTELAGMSKLAKSEITHGFYYSQ